jgi:hypothetical protein
VGTTCHSLNFFFLQPLGPHSCAMAKAACARPGPSLPAPDSTAQALESNLGRCCHARRKGTTEGKKARARRHPIGPPHIAPSRQSRGGTPPPPSWRVARPCRRPALVAAQQERGGSNRGFFVNSFPFPMRLLILFSCPLVLNSFSSSRFSLSFYCYPLFFPP